MRTCSKCNESKDESCFHLHKKKGLQYICKPCKSLQQKEYRAKDKEAFNARKLAHHKAKKLELKKFILSYLKENPCVSCGEKDPIVLEFDHRCDKKFNIAKGLAAGYSLDTIKAEIEKCDVRCANCHKRKTAKDFNWYKSQGGVAQ